MANRTSTQDSPAPSVVTTPSVLEAFRAHATADSYGTSRPSPLEPESHSDPVVPLPSSREDVRKESWNAVTGLDMNTPLRQPPPVAGGRTGPMQLERPLIDDDDSRGASPFPLRQNSASQSPHAGLSNAAVVGMRPRPAALARCTSLTNEMDDATIAAMRRMDPTSAASVPQSQPFGLKGYVAPSPSEVESSKVAPSDSLPFSSPSPWLPPSLARIDARDGAVIKETAALIAGWLHDHGFTESLRALRSDVGMNGRDEFLYRKTLRTIATAVTEGRWEAAHNATRSLFAPTSAARQDPTVAAAATATRPPTAVSSVLEGGGGQTQHQRTTSPNGNGAEPAAAPHSFDVAIAERRLTLLLLEQQLLELVDAGDASKAFSFLRSKIKPMEADLTAQRFQRLLYACGCKSVSEAAASLASTSNDRTLLGWSVENGRHALVREIRRELTASHAASEGRFGNLLGTDTYISRHTMPTFQPQSLHSLLEMAASYQAIRLALLSGSATPQEVLNALADPLAAPLNLQSAISPLQTQLPPLRCFHSVYAPPPALDDAHVALCRAVYLNSMRCIVYGTSGGSLYTVSRGTAFSSPPPELKVTKLGYDHFGAVSGLAVADKSVLGLAPLVLSASVDGSAAIRTLSVDSQGRVRSVSVGFGQTVHGDGVHVTSCALLPDGSMAILGDAHGRISIWNTGVTATPAAASNRHARTSVDAAAVVVGNHDRSPALIPVVSHIASGGRDDQPASLSAPVLLHLVPLDHKLLPQTAHCGLGPVKPGSSASKAATSWSANAVVAIEAARHGLHVITLQKSGVICCVSTALGIVLRRINAPDTMGRLSDASGLALSESALHAFVAFGASKVVRAVNLSDGSWTSDAFTWAGSVKDALTSIAVVSGDGFLVAGTSGGKVVSWSTTVERAAFSTPYDVALAAAQQGGSSLRLHSPVSIIDLEQSPEPNSNGVPASSVIRRAVADIRQADCVSLMSPVTTSVDRGRPGEDPGDISVIQSSPLMNMFFQPNRATTDATPHYRLNETKTILVTCVDGCFQWIGTPPGSVQ